MHSIFTYMFKSSNFWKNYSALIIVTTIANILINGSGIFNPIQNSNSNLAIYYSTFIAGFVIMFIPYGYSIEILKTVLNNYDDFPKISIKNSFINGLKVIISVSVLVAIIAVILILYGFIKSFLTPFISDILSYIMSVALILTFFIITFFGISMCCNYVNKPSYLNFINFNACVDTINKNTGNYFKNYILLMIITGVTYLILFLFGNVCTKIGYFGLVLYSIISAALWTYVAFIYARIMSNAIK